MKRQTDLPKREEGASKQTLKPHTSRKRTIRKRVKQAIREAECQANDDYQ